jgi:hypothetical protein
MLRKTIRSFCDGGKRVSNAQIYDALGMSCLMEKKRLRSSVHDMVMAGEVIKVESGLYEYNFKYRPRKNDSIPKLWLFIRSQKPGWSKVNASQLTCVEYTQTIRYFNWLEAEGYIVRHGKDGKTILYRATDKAVTSPEAPYPPATDRNSFEWEKAVAAQIARLMRRHDPYQPETARDIVAACKELLARFEKGVTQLENEGETRRRKHEHCE